MIIKAIADNFGISSWHICALSCALVKVSVQATNIPVSNQN